MSDTAHSVTTGISRTSIYTAAGRAIGAREPDPSVRNPDSLAEKLLGDPAAFNLTHSSIRALALSYDEAMKDVEVVSTVRMMLVRTRFIDEALERAVAGDIQHEDLAEVLRRHGHDQSQRTFFIMEGVTMYVPEEGVRATLRYVAGHPPGSAIVFDHVPPDGRDAEQHRLGHSA